MSCPSKIEPATSRLPGFYRAPLEQRLAQVAESLSSEARQVLGDGGGLPLEIADRMSENVIACHGLPLSVALNFLIDGRDVRIPMAVEEPSVVAAASRAALLIRQGGGFHGSADQPIMTAQIQIEDVVDVDRAARRIDDGIPRILATGDAAIPSMVARGGGCRDIDVRVLDRDLGMMVVHLHVHVGDAMGANLVDTVAEAVAPLIADLSGGRIGLRILSNLPLRRRVRVWAEVPEHVIGGRAVAERIVRASRFAELDPFRAVTHNKGILNGVDAAAVALGQDWRAIEAGAHAFAALGDGDQTGYRPLAIWRIVGDRLRGELEMPLAVGIVGGATRCHPTVRAALEMVQVQSAGQLAIVVASAGLASNLAALDALAGEGIQRGHMKLHERRTKGMADVHA